MKRILISLIFTGAAFAQSPATKQLSGANQEMTGVRGLNAEAEAGINDGINDPLDSAAQIDNAKTKVDRYLASPVNNDAAPRESQKRSASAYSCCISCSS